MRAASRLAGALTALALATGGCATGGLQGVELPGGADLGDDPYTVTIEFADVLELVPQSLVKVNDVNVGSVTGIRVSPRYTALVDVAVNRDVRIPADAVARIAQTSLLGEKYVEIDPAPGPAGARPGPPIADGATIPLARTSTAAEVEQVLGALSMLLNGGGVAQIRDIAVELNSALDGREGDVRALLADLDQLVGALDDRKGDITRALDGLNRLSSVLRERRGQIRVALDDLAPGLRELERQRGDLVELLRALDELSHVATDVVHRSRADVVDDLQLLRPVLRKLAESGDDLPNSLGLLLTFPFTDEALEAFAGDYANLYVRPDLDLSDLAHNLLTGAQPVAAQAPRPTAAAPGAQPPSVADLLAPLQGLGATRPPVPLPGAAQHPSDALDLHGGGS